MYNSSNPVTLTNLVCLMEFPLNRLISCVLRWDFLIQFDFSTSEMFIFIVHTYVIPLMSLYCFATPFIVKSISQILFLVTYNLLLPYRKRSPFLLYVLYQNISRVVHFLAVLLSLACRDLCQWRLPLYHLYCWDFPGWAQLWWSMCMSYDEAICPT